MKLERQGKRFTFKFFRKDFFILVLLAFIASTSVAQDTLPNRPFVKFTSGELRVGNSLTFKNQFLSGTATLDSMTFNQRRIELCKDNEGHVYSYLSGLQSPVSSSNNIYIFTSVSQTWSDAPTAANGYSQRTHGGAVTYYFTKGTNGIKRLNAKNLKGVFADNEVANNIAMKANRKKNYAGLMFGAGASVVVLSIASLFVLNHDTAETLVLPEMLAGGIGFTSSLVLSLQSKKLARRAVTTYTGYNFD